MKTMKTLKTMEAKAKTTACAGVAVAAGRAVGGEKRSEARRKTNSN